MLKQGREIKTDICDLFRTSYGTVDITSLKSLFINLSTWAEPTEDLDNWDKVIKNFKSRIKNTLHKELNISMFKNLPIVDLDLRASGLKKGKRSFVKCEITLFVEKLKKPDIKSSEIRTPINSITHKIIDDSFLKYKTFKFYNSKN